MNWKRFKGNREHADTLLSGRAAWREWRQSTAESPDLRGIDLSGRNLDSIDLQKADLRDANLSQSNLRRARLNQADLRGCIARFTRFSEAKLSGAMLQGADVRAASFRRADLTKADFTGAILRFTSFAGTTVEDTVFTSAEVFGVGAWNLKGEPADQSGLVIREKEGAIGTTVDDLETAQFLSLLRENRKIADVINTANKRTVLLLGRFRRPYKEVLDGLHQHLLERNFVPILFDFERPAGRDLTETVASLAHLACFVVPDLSGAKSVPQELSFIVPFLPSVPVLPILRSKDERIYSMFEHFQRYPWVQEVVLYDDLDHLLSIADKRIVSVGFKAAMSARGIDNAKLPKMAPGSRRRPASKGRQGS